MIRENFSINKLGLIVFDLIIINLSYFITFVLELGFHIPKENLDAYLRVAPWICVFSVIIFFLCDLYSNWLDHDRLKVLSVIMVAVALTTILTMGLNYMSHNLAMPRTVTVLNLAVEVILLGASRLLIWSLYQKKHEKKKTLVIDKDLSEAQTVAKDFRAQGQRQYVVNGTYSIEHLDELELLLDTKNIDVVAMRAQLARQEEIITLCIKKHKEILIVPDIPTILMHQTAVQTVNDKLFFSLKPLTISPVKRTIKRAFDLVMSLLLLIILSPAMLIIAAGIMVTSPGSAFFRQERLGEKGKSFQLLKFRSMINNAEEETGPVLATENDPRITKFGNFLRNTRLDELPQLINVLRGEMSLVGPRPEREFFVKQFMETIPYYSYRMDVKPGLTGLAQIMGRYNTSPEDKLRFDLVYISKCSFLFDLDILLMTAKVVFNRDRADGVKVEYDGGVKFEYNEATKYMVS